MSDISNLDTVTQQIRFHLHQIKPRNAHHEFEHLCRHLAKAKIFENILPATGPVAGSGDQGRDFETYRTYTNGIFSGNTTDKDISFGCTLQEKGIKGKIINDVRTIMDSPMNTDEIHYFYGDDLKVADRHELQSQVATEYSIRLEIYDAQAISEMLADPKVFWIAEKFLSIPKEIFPEVVEQKNEWYKEIKENSINIDDNVNYAEYTNIKLAVRHSLKDDDLKIDINFWFLKLKEIKEKAINDNIIDKVIYELIVYAIKTSQSEEVESEIYSYLNKIYEVGESFNYEQLEGRAIILQYSIGLFARGIVMKDENEIKEWKDQLYTIVDNNLQAASSVNDEVILLELKGFLVITVSSEQALQDSLKQAIEIWTNVIDLIDEAPLFPLQRFLDRINEYAFSFDNYDAFSHLMDKTEKALATREGEISLAEKAKQRAMKLFENQNYIEAIKQFHKVKINWYQKETINGSILTLLMLSKCYLELSLPYAAKYNALLASEVAHASGDANSLKFFVKGIEQASYCDHVTGAWYSYLDLMEVGTMGNILFEPNPSDYEKFQSWAYNTTMILNLSEKFDSAIFQTTAQNIFSSSLKEYVEELYPLAREEYIDKPLDHIWTQLEEQLLWKPFSDSTRQRSYTFIALGITWNIQWENTYEITPKAEQFLSLLQTILAEIAREDFMFLSTTVYFELTLSSSNELTINNQPSNESRRWEILLPRKFFDKKEDMMNYQTEFVVIIHQVLRDISLLEKDKFNELVEKEIENGILTKALFKFSYEVIYRSFRTEEYFNSYTTVGQVENVTEHAFKLNKNDRLPWLDADANYLSKQDRLKTIEKRYENAEKPIRLTLKKVLEDQNLITEIRILKQQKNYKDWHILMAIATIAVNYRVNSLSQYRDVEHHQKLFQQMLNKEENDSDISIPNSEFTIKRIDETIMINALSSLQMMGYHQFQKTPDFLGIEHFMRKRLNYFDEDIEHEEIF